MTGTFLSPHSSLRSYRQVSTAMQIPLSSNIVTIVCEVVEVVLCILLTGCIKIIIGALHAKKLYEESDGIILYCSRLRISGNYGVMTRRLYRFSVPVTITAALLIYVGGFGSTGVNFDMYEDVVVKYVLRGAENKDLVDLNRHISLDGKISGTLIFIFLVEQRCFG